MSDSEPEHSSRSSARNAVVNYYSQASQDYEAWSPRFNMHFGYWRAGINPFRLESMLDEMTRQAVARLALPDRAVRLLDMGCGLGASARLIGRERPAAHIHGLTIVSWQADHALDLARKEAVADRVNFVQGDYAAAPLGDRSYDGIYAVESACHASGPDKSELIREVARLLRPGARFVVADGFLKHSRPMGPLFGWCYRKVSHNWAVEEFAQLEAFVAALRDAGLEGVEVEEISYRIAPSVMHIPRVTARFLVRELFRTQLRLGAIRWGHILACVLSPIVGAARSRFGYFLISASRPQAD